jgi:hypothetical protein
MSYPGGMGGLQDDQGPDKPARPRKVLKQAGNTNIVHMLVTPVSVTLAVGDWLAFLGWCHAQETTGSPMKTVISDIGGQVLNGEAT